MYKIEIYRISIKWELIFPVWFIGEFETRNRL